MNTLELIIHHRLNIQFHDADRGKLSVWNSATSDEWLTILTHEYPDEATALAAVVQEFHVKYGKGT